MRVREPGKIRDNLWLLGREESCVYLLEGDNLGDAPSDIWNLV